MHEHAAVHIRHPIIINDADLDLLILGGGCHPTTNIGGLPPNNLDLHSIVPPSVNSLLTTVRMYCAYLAYTNE